MMGPTLSVPVISTASLKPVMSISRFMMTALRVIRNVGQFARWSTLVSPKGPQPLLKILLVMLIVSLHAGICVMLSSPMPGQPHTYFPESSKLQVSHDEGHTCMLTHNAWKTCINNHALHYDAPRSIQLPTYYLDLLCVSLAIKDVNGKCCVPMSFSNKSDILRYK